MNYLNKEGTQQLISLIKSALNGKLGVNDKAASAGTSDALKDAGNSVRITIAYSKEGLASTNWLAGWNGYELRTISPANVTAGNASKVNNHSVNADVPANAKFTDTNTWNALKGSTTSADGSAGYAPAPAKGAANRYLRCDGTWQVPPDNDTHKTWGLSISGRTISLVEGGSAKSATLPDNNTQYSAITTTWMDNNLT